MASILLSRFEVSSWRALTGNGWTISGLGLGSWVMRTGLYEEITNTEGERRWAMLAGERPSRLLCDSSYRGGGKPS